MSLLGKLQCHDELEGVNETFTKKKLGLEILGTKLLQHRTP